MSEDTQTNEDNEASQGQEARKGLPVSVDLSEPEIQDPAGQQAPTVWMGANAISFKLLRCVEAVRDLTRTLQSIAEFDDPLSDKRGAKILATPLYTLASCVRDIFNELEGNAKDYSTVSLAQHKELRERAARFAKQVSLDRGSDLRAVRKKISAHVDKDAVITPDKYWSKVDLLAYLRWMKVCLEQIMHLLTLDVYGWTRESGHPDVWSLMSVDGTVVDLYMQNGKPVSILNITLVKSPKYSIANEIKKLVTLYNKVAVRCQQVYELYGLTEEEIGVVAGLEHE